jgi:hypothetical protein
MVFLTFFRLAASDSFNSIVSKCPFGFPVVIGAKDQDANTQIDTWDRAPLSTDALIVGGTTWSSSVTETKLSENICGKGCGLIAGWNIEKEVYFARYVYQNMRGVLSITSNKNTKRSVVLFSRDYGDKGERATGLAFLKWSLQDVTELPQLDIVDRGYYFGYPVETFQTFGFSKFMLLQQARLHLIINAPGATTVHEIFCILDGDKSAITDVYQEKYSTINHSATFWGTPTRKYQIMEGWDEFQILQLATITPERGA